MTTENSKIGVFRDMSLEDYLAHPALSSSMLRDLANPEMTPLACVSKWTRPEKKPSSHLTVGAATHSAILEGNIDLDGYFLLPEGHKGTTREGKARLAEAKAAGMPTLKHEERKAVEGMYRGVHFNTLAKALLGACEPEVSIFWEDEETGLACKARLDGLPFKGQFFPDLKTTSSGLADSNLEKAIANYRYDIQAAWYESGLAALELVEEPEMVFIFADKSDPHECRIARLNKATRDWAQIHCRQWKLKYQDYLASDCWPSWPSHIAEIGVPRWKEIQWEAEDAMEGADDA